LRVVAVDGAGIANHAGTAAPVPLRYYRLLGTVGAASVTVGVWLLTRITADSSQGAVFGGLRAPRPAVHGQLIPESY
jgi:hypothetical protein